MVVVEVADDVTATIKTIVVGSEVSSPFGPLTLVRVLLPLGTPRVEVSCAFH